jgi:hypothetical protein
MEELGTRSTIERVETETLFLRCCAPSFYPDSDRVIYETLDYAGHNRLCF